MTQAIRLKVVRNERLIPTVLWLPRRPPAALLLACHGGGGHKQAKSIQAYVDAFLPLSIAVLAIDGPVHGERRQDGNLDPDLAKTSFRQAWIAGVGQIDIAKDFSAALDVASQRPALANLPVGYIGVSMGTAYGIPLLAIDKRITAAVLGMWGLSYPACEHLPGYAAQVSCAIWFNQQWDDAIFDRVGTANLFEAIGSEQKRLAVYPGPHGELSDTRLDEAVRFLTGHLTTH
jgi:alpha-beta hydrolase superfamily lysophospholipase